MVVFKGINKKDSISYPLKFILLFYGLGPFLYLTRVIVGDEGGVSVILRSFEPLLILVITRELIKLIKHEIPTFFIYLFIIAIYGTIVGIIQGNLTLDVISGLSHFLTGLLVCIYFYLKGAEQNFHEFMRLLSLFSLSSITLVIMIMYALPSVLGIHVYLGLACQVLIVIFFFNVHQKNLLYSVLSLVLIVASGKRGVLVALIIGVGISFVPFFVRYHLKATSRVLAIALIAILYVASDNSSFSGKLADKFTYDDSKSMNDYSSGRVIEAYSAMDYWMLDNTRVFFGAGLGFTYKYKHTTPGLLNVENYKNVHFSYLNPLISFGVPIALVYFLILLYILFRIIKSKDVEYAYLKWTCVTYFIYACFVFNLFNEPILWLSIGYILNRSKTRKNRGDLCQT